MVFFHAHEGRIRVRPGVTVRPVEDLFLRSLPLQIPGPVLFCIYQSLTHLFAHRFVFQYLIDLVDRIGDLLHINLSKSRWAGIFEFFLGYVLCILPEFLQLLLNPLLAYFYGFAPYERAPVGLRFDLGPIHIHHFKIDQPFCSR
jgi:hypothetical protein